MSNIYTSEGWVNIPAIAEAPTWLKVVIGARQVGKTYGTLKYYLDTGKRFILLRRTTDELKFIGSNSDLDPFSTYEPDYRTRLQAFGGSFKIVDYNEDGIIPGSERGIALSLPQISHIRGFNGSSYEAVVFDEAIPEKGVRTLRTEGEALLNAYTTINGNRELKGGPPLILWLLANTNNIDSRILEALNLVDPIIWMRSKGLEYYERNGVSIFQGKSEEITDKRKQTALARQISERSEFAGMAYNNEWAYDQSPLIKPRSIRRMTPVCSYDDTLYIWEDASSMYVCSAQHKADRYQKNPFDTSRFITHYYWLKRWYIEGMVTFSNLKLLALFKRLFELDF